MMLERWSFQRHVPQENFCSRLPVENVDVLKDDSRLWCWEGGMPGASTLKECATLESIVKNQAAEGRFYAAIYASSVVVFGSWDCSRGLLVIHHLWSSYPLLQLRPNHESNKMAMQ
ncbi:hypothetical protein OROHE_015974 [Orobanche hederae]